ncbi:hypothetical protein NL676_018164 [Syzygium grande]|nr:hypothetical protein NL676_018164 [Syzygium grande]
MRMVVEAMLDWRCGRRRGAKKSRLCSPWPLCRETLHPCGCRETHGGEPSARPSPFLAKTYQLVDDPAIDSVISWSGDGSAFVVRNPTARPRPPPRCFKHNNFSNPSMTQHLVAARLPPLLPFGNDPLPFRPSGASELTKRFGGFFFFFFGDLGRSCTMGWEFSNDRLGGQKQLGRNPARRKISPRPRPVDLGGRR